ncbi:hypothetical protein CHU92_08645 [Flavobacterium cyanobacteriorum]|uniref:Uncharacterized protein n=1 Tax=Flavobacterium cyanobacteriorum TaxID=2022802 RepID=A0A255Z6S4_9FLAO|nr:Rossmann-like and DUF2520 domain-containing protein [Flavobacterium cyanobacteriorum]OYQ37247.1 hypothetical protein CHU92_08645 [Flavobacterium cyanobacteriorum]
MIKVVVLGSGNVAQHLISVYKAASGIELVQAFARNTSALEHLLPEDNITSTYTGLAEADVYIIAVTDNAVAGVSGALPFRDRLVVHTSGSMPMGVLCGTNRRGVFYPLQTFSKTKQVDFTTVPFCIESENDEDYKLLYRLASAVSGSVYRIDSLQRRALHVAAVFVSNFTNHLYKIGMDICLENNIPFDILKPLILETADKIKLLAPGEAQTGPALRNDTLTLEKHMDFLKEENLKKIYTLLTQSIQLYGGKL